MLPNNQKQFEVRDLRRKEKFFVDDLYLNGYAKKCGIYATGVYLSLCRHASKDQECYPSYRKIAEELKISERQVGRSIKVLENQNIIKIKQLGKKLNNRYYLLDKSEWTNSPFTPDHQSTHLRTDSPVHSKDTYINETQKKGDFLLKNNLILVEAYKRGDRKYKPFYMGDEMRWRPDQQKWYAIPKQGGDWLLFCGRESEIEWKLKYNNF